MTILEVVWCLVSTVIGAITRPPTGSPGNNLMGAETMCENCTVTFSRAGHNLIRWSKIYLHYRVFGIY